MVRNVAVENLERPGGSLSLLHDLAGRHHLRQPTRRRIRRMTCRCLSKRALLVSVGGLFCMTVARPSRAALPPMSRADHERFMRLAIVEARRNPAYPFGAVIVRPDTGEVMARGVNNS